MKRVLFLNGESVQSLCLGRSFRQQGWSVVGLCTARCSSGYVSRYLSERLIVPNIHTNPEEFTQFLYAYLSKNHVDLIIPLIDDSADYLNVHKAELESKFGVKCVAESGEAYEIASNKGKLMELCFRHGINHPRTLTLPQHIDMDNEQELKSFPYPALIKPDRSAGARGIVRVNKYEDLIRELPESQRSYGACTLQEFIVQPDYYYNVMIYRAAAGNICGSTVVKIRRMFPIEGGSSCYCETIENVAIVKQCAAVLDILGWHGFADFDVLEDLTTGELKIIEINPRVPSSLQAAFAAGIDFGRIFAADCLGEPVPTFDYKAGMQIRWFGLDVMWFLFSNKRFKFKPSWFKFLGKNISYQDGDITNPLPILAGCLAGVAHYLDPEERKAKLKKK